MLARNLCGPGPGGAGNLSGTLARAGNLLSYAVPFSMRFPITVAVRLQDHGFAERVREVSRLLTYLKDPIDVGASACSGLARKAVAYFR